MKKALVLLFFIFFLSQIAAQREADNWYFGLNAGVNFSTGEPVALPASPLSTMEGCATISDPNGNLLFYTDGITIWNRNHTEMPNGTDLNGDPSSTQSAIIVPKSDEPNIYYVFTVDKGGEAEGLQYSVIDMNLDGGLGDISAQKAVPLITPVSEKITAVAHANGNAIWVISRSSIGNSYYSFLVDATGVNHTPVVTDIGITLSSNPTEKETIGYLKTSPDGRFLASAISYQDNVELMHFDTATGILSDLILLKPYFDTVTFDYDPYGVEFSPNSQILYIAQYRGLHQFDISNYDQNAIIASGLRITPIDNDARSLGAIQMGPDGKMYFLRSFSRYLSVINNPDVLGAGCDFQDDAVYLGPDVRSATGLPPFITSFFHVGIETENVCFGDVTEFSIEVSEPITSITWSFGDGNSSILETPSNTYTAPGDYTVTVTAMTATSSSTDTKEITIYDIPTANAASDFEVCTESATYEFNLATKDAEILGSQLATNYQIFYYPTQVDADDNTNQLTNLYTNTLATETIFARIQNRNNPACFDTTSFDLVLQKAPIVNAQTDWTVCDTDMDGFYTFDLSQKTTSILENNSPTEFTVSYYRSQADLDVPTSAIAMNYTNTIAREEIFWRIENNTYPSCYGEGTFFIEVISGVTANTPANFEVCDDDNDGFFEFDLTTKEPEILGTQNAASVNITFHATLLEAEDNTDALNNNTYTNSIGYNETLFVRIENTADASCYDTTSFELVISDTPTVQPVMNWQVCDDNNDGVFSFDLSEKDDEILGNHSATNYTITYHNSFADAELNEFSINGILENTSNPQTIFYRLEHNSNAQCFITGDFNLEVYDTPTAFNASPIVSCDTNESGSLNFDFSQKDAEILNGQDATLFEVSYFGNEADAINNQNPVSKSSYTNTNLEEVIYARVQHSNLEACFAISNFQLRILPLPEPNLEEQYVICPDSPELNIDGGEYESWSWRDTQNNQVSTARILNVTALGEYSLSVSHSPTGLSCEKTISFEVVSSGAPENFTTELSDFSDLITIEVDATGIGEFEYSSDGENFQDSNRLEVFPGTHTISVRDQFLCRTISKEVIALGFQKFFTPNGDGIHETWNIIGVENFPNSQIFIFNRQGKFLKQLTPEGAGWDGTFQGQQLPSSDYWFRFINEDGTVHSGHFTLKR